MEGGLNLAAMSYLAKVLLAKSMDFQSCGKRMQFAMEKQYILVKYNDLTATSLGMMVSKGNHPQHSLISG